MIFSVFTLFINKKHMKKLYIKGFQNLYMDTIAAIYEIEQTDTISIKHAIHSKYLYYYNIDLSKKYLVVCGQSDYIIENGKVECIFRSKSHPFNS